MFVKFSNIYIYAHTCWQIYVCVVCTFYVLVKHILYWIEYPKMITIYILIINIGHFHLYSCNYPTRF